MTYQLQEGRLTLPPGFHDRTVNIFVNGQVAPYPFSLTVSRDTLLGGEALPDYLERQVALISAKLRQFQRLATRPAQLSSLRPLPGLEIDSRYHAEGRDVHQRQAVFSLGSERLLVFSASSQTPFTPDDDRLWQELLASFVPTP